LASGRRNVRIRDLVSAGLRKTGPGAREIFPASASAVPRREHMAVELDVGYGVSGAKGVPVAGERVGDQLHVGQRPVVHVPAQELVEARGVVAEPHVVLARGGVPPHGVESVGVERSAGRAGLSVVLVGPRPGGGGGLAVGGVAVGGGGVPVGGVGGGFDVRLVVVVVVAGAGVGAGGGGLGDPFPVGGVGVAPPVSLISSEDRPR